MYLHLSSLIRKHPRTFRHPLLPSLRLSPKQQTLHLCRREALETLATTKLMHGRMSFTTVGSFKQLAAQRANLATLFIA